MSRNFVEAPMEGSVLSFLKEKWEVSGTGSAQCWASSSFGHCFVCSPIYGIWLPPWYLQNFRLKLCNLTLLLRTSLSRTGKKFTGLLMVTVLKKKLTWLKSALKSGSSYLNLKMKDSECQLVTSQERYKRQSVSCIGSCPYWVLVHYNGVLFPAIGSIVFLWVRMREKKHVISNTNMSSPEYKSQALVSINGESTINV